MPQAFADAVCNVHAKTIRYVGMDDHARVQMMEQHGLGTMRGMEGTNGVACKACMYRAERIWEDYQRILGQLAAREERKRL